MAKAGASTSGLGKSGVTWRVVFNDLPKIADRLGIRADAIVTKTALDLQAGAQDRAPVDTGYLRGSIRAHRVGKAHWRVTVGADYGIYPELGTRYMAARPYLAPAARAVRQQFINALKGGLT